jgi:Fic-DOC domain mobile mystery protein B
LHFIYPEGATPLDLNEIEGLKLLHVQTQSELNALESANINEGLQWLKKLRRPDVFSRDFVLELHRRLFGDVWDWAGKYRRTGKNIGVDPHNISVELQLAIDDAKYWVEHTTYHPQEIAIRFHHALTKIHPFPNGNGRHARIIAEAILEKHFRTKRFGWLENNQLGNNSPSRTRYIQALKDADRDDFSALLAFTKDSQE